MPTCLLSLGLALSQWTEGYGHCFQGWAGQDPGASRAAVGLSDKGQMESILGSVRSEGSRREFTGPFGTRRLEFW